MRWQQGDCTPHTRKTCTYGMTCSVKGKAHCPAPMQHFRDMAVKGRIVQQMRQGRRPAAAGAVPRPGRAGRKRVGRRRGGSIPPPVTSQWKHRQPCWRIPLGTRTHESSACVRSRAVRMRIIGFSSGCASSKSALPNGFTYTHTHKPILRTHARTHARSRARTHARTHAPVHSCTLARAHMQARAHAQECAGHAARKSARHCGGGGIGCGFGCARLAQGGEHDCRQVVTAVTLGWW